MVRLVADSRLWNMNQSACFNSTMVRLVECAPNLMFNPFEMFQFHYGTIGRCTMPSYPLSHTCFNSTMVRLVVEGNPLYFHFLLSFNSTMVRLVETKIFKVFLQFEFQFHYGTIGRCDFKGV